MGFFSELEQRARRINSLLCVGLDPHLPDLPRQDAAGARDFCLRLIDATADIAAAFKPNAGFFEVFGAAGMQSLADVIRAVPEGIPVVLDAKRGDIASTAQAYAQAVFQTLGADAVTLSPYLGYDSLQPFLQDSSRGAFLLCKTSNLGSGDLQDLTVASLPAGLQGGSGLTLYQVVALLAQSWNKADNLGLVVGATHPQALQQVRALAPNLWILAPGVGAQGGELHATLQAGLRMDGMGLLLPVSRTISRAADPRQTARDLVDQMNEQRKEVRKQREQAALESKKAAVHLAAEVRLVGTGKNAFVEASPQKLPEQLQPLAYGLLKAGCVKFGQFKLKSGLISPIYLDLRQLVGYPDILAQVAQAYLPLLAGLQFDRLAALPYAALPIGTAVSLQGGWPLIYPRKEVKEYGTRADIEGVYNPGEKVVVIDDLATTGGSKFEALEKLGSAGLVAKDIVVLIDRQSGAAQALAEVGCRLHAVFTLSQLLDYWEAAGQVSPEMILAVRQFLAGA